MLSKNKIKHISSLNIKKFRERHNVFVAEGTKLVTDLFSSNLTIKTLVCTQNWINSFPKFKTVPEIIIDNPEAIKKISSLKNTPEVIALIEIPSPQLDLANLNDQLILALDEIQDPGNLGTIIRLADWFGIKNILASTNCADRLNAKVIQSTMGAIGRVNIFYTDLIETIQNLKQTYSMPVFGTYLEGDNIYELALPSSGIIVMGNEGKGISADVSALITQKLFIPNFPTNTTTVESLNVGVAAGIICSEFRRRLV